MIDAMAGGALPVSAALFYTVVVNALSGKITTIDCLGPVEMDIQLH
jgi:hypothetical protein